MIDISAPGSFLDMRGVAMMISREAMPTPSVTQSVCCRWLRYTPHLGRNSLGTSLSPSPRKSLICVEKMVSAMPAVKPTTMG